MCFFFVFCSLFWVSPHTSTTTAIGLFIPCDVKLQIHDVASIGCTLLNFTNVLIFHPQHRCRKLFNMGGGGGKASEANFNTWGGGGGYCKMYIHVHACTHTCMHTHLHAAKFSYTHPWMHPRIHLYLRVFKIKASDHYEK